MGRYVNPTQVILDGNGDPIVGAKLYFYEPGTTTFKTIFSDSGLTTSRANPAIADANGRYQTAAGAGPIFLDGIYKTEQKDAADVTIWTQDPVGDVIEGEFQLWVTGTIYNIPQIVLGSDDEYYRSLIDSNQGNDPTTSPIQWEQLRLGRVWNTNATYAVADSAYGSDGYLYVSKTASNSGNNPTSSRINWDAGSNPALSGLGRGYIDGLKIERDTDTDHDIKFNIGVARDSTNAENLNLTAAIVKQIDVDWAEGTADGGFPSGLTLAIDTWYHVFIILKDDGTTIDAGFDTSTSATNLLADATDYAEFRRVGSVLTDGSSNILAFDQFDNHFMWDTIPLDVSATSITDTTASYTLSIPPDFIHVALVNFNVIKAGAQASAYLFSPANAGQTASLTASPLATFSNSLNVAAAGDAGILTFVHSNTSKQIQGNTNVGSGGVTINIATIGWIDSRGRNA